MQKLPDAATVIWTVVLVLIGSVIVLLVVAATASEGGGPVTTDVPFAPASAPSIAGGRL